MKKIGLLFLNKFDVFFIAIDIRNVVLQKYNIKIINYNINKGYMSKDLSYSVMFYGLLTSKSSTYTHKCTKCSTTLQHSFAHFSNELSAPEPRPILN